MKDILLNVFAVVVIVTVIVVSPLAVVWSLNTLFHTLAIPYNFYTWLAVVILNVTWFYKGQFKFKF